jgi:hypothetical protein
MINPHINPPSMEVAVLNNKRMERKVDIIIKNLLIPIRKIV